MIRIKHEKAWLGHFASREGLDLVISDNRYGLAVPGVFCVFVTHQLLIKTPFGKWADGMLQFLNYRMIRRFSRCWVPDSETAGLAGALAHPRRLPGVTTRYIGWLSRFGGTAGDRRGAVEGGRGAAGGGQGDGYVVALLSGPEPQRTLFEKELLRQASLSLGGPLVLVRGLPGGGGRPAGLRPSGLLPTGLPPSGLLPAGLPTGVTCFDHLPAGELESLLRGARLVIARAGYSSIMDLCRLGKRALLVPTPGQTEQEYLGAYLAGKGWASCVDQRVFSLPAAFELAMADSAPVGGRPAEDRGVLAAEIRTILKLAQSGSPALG